MDGLVLSEKNAVKGYEAVYSASSTFRSGGLRSSEVNENKYVTSYFRKTKKMAPFYGKCDTIISNSLKANQARLPRGLKMKQGSDRMDRKECSRMNPINMKYFWCNLGQAEKASIHNITKMNVLQTIFQIYEKGY